MTTTNPAVSLDSVGEALVNAHDVLAGKAEEEAIEDALVALCRASYDVLLRWEVDVVQQAVESRPEPESWRTPLDELRVQAALAEMELRDAGVPGVQVAERLVTSVSELLTTARRDVGGALDTLRTELRKVVR